MTVCRLDNLFDLIREDFSTHSNFKRVMVEIRKFFEELELENKKQRENGDIYNSLARIAGYLFICNIYNCFSCAKYVTNFLTHKSSLVS